MLEYREVVTLQSKPAGYSRMITQRNPKLFSLFFCIVAGNMTDDDRTYNFTQNQAIMNYEGE
jgi:hypothetical protein